MNATRGEPFTVDISFDCHRDALRDFTLTLKQRGRIMLTKAMGDAVIDETGYNAAVTLSGEETAQLRPNAPVFAQVRAELLSGDALYSGVHEINVVDILDAGEGRK